MLLLVGLFTFLIGLAPLVQADTAFTTPSLPSFSESKDTHSGSTTDTLTPPLAQDLNKYGTKDSPSQVMDEAKKKEARNNLDNYTSYMWVDDGKILTPSASLMMQTIFVRSQFFVTKTIYRFVNAVNSKLNGDGIITKWSTEVFASVQSIYAQFSTPEFYPIIAIGIISSLLFYWLKRRLLEGFRKILLVMLLGGAFIYGGSDLTSSINTSLNSVLTSVVKTVKVAGVSASNVNDLKTTMVEIPFLYLNFDGVQINANKTSNIKEEDIDQLLASEDDNDVLKSIQTNLKDYHLTSSKLGEKFLTAFASMVNAVLIGFIYLAFAIISFVMRMLFLILLLLLPFVAVMALFPLFDVVVLRWSKATGGTLILSNFVLIGTAVIGVIDGMISSGISTAIGSDYFFVTFVKLIVYVMLFKYRHKILDIFKAGHLSNNRFATRVDGLLSNARRRGGNIIKKPLAATTSAGLVAGLTAGQMVKGKAKSIAKEHLTADTGSLTHGRFNKKAEKIMNKVDQADPQSAKGQRLLAKEEKMKERLAQKKQRFNQPNGLKSKLNDYRNEVVKNRKGAFKAEELAKKQKDKKEAVRERYEQTQNQITARAMERRMRAEYPEQEKPNLVQSAQKKKMQDQVKQKEVRESAQRMTKRFKEHQVLQKKGTNSSSKPQFKVKGLKKQPWEKSSPFTQKIPKNPFEV